MLVIDRLRFLDTRIEQNYSQKEVVETKCGGKADSFVGRRKTSEFFSVVMSK
jgi:hypothetical protein